MHPGKTLKLFNQLSRSPLDFPHPAFQNLVHKVPKHASSSPARLPCPVKGTKSSLMWPTSTIFIPSCFADLIRVGRKLQVLHVISKIKCNNTSRWKFYSCLSWLTFLSFPFGFGQCFSNFHLHMAITHRVWFRKSGGWVWDSAFLASSQLLSVLLVHTLSSKALGSNIFLCFDQLAPWSIHYCFQYKLMPRSHSLCFLPSSAESADPLSVMRLLSWPLLTSVALARTGRDNGSYEDWWVLRGGECIRKRSKV